MGRGPVATMLVQRGTLKVGDAIVAGDAWGKVRALYNFKGEKLKDAKPGDPVEILGFEHPPTAGEQARVVDHERDARDVAEKRGERLRREQLAQRSRRGVSLEGLFAEIQEGAVRDLNLVVKADVQGSLEAIAGELAKIQHAEVRVTIIHQGVGGITEGDVMLAAASDALVVGFNVRPRRSRSAQQVARREPEGVEAARDLAAEHVAVVPVGRPVSAEVQTGRVRGVDRPAVEVGDLGRVRGVGEVDDRQPALVPGLHHDVATRNRHDRAVVGHAVLLRGLHCRQLVVARELQLAVDDVEERVGAPLRLVGHRQRAAVPPPHSSVKMTLVPSLLNVAECQYEKFGSATASSRTGFTGSEMSSRMPLPWHAPAASPISGYEVMSWHVFVFGSGEYGVPDGCSGCVGRVLQAVEGARRRVGEDPRLARRSPPSRAPRAAP